MCPCVCCVPGSLAEEGAVGRVVGHPQTGALSEGQRVRQVGRVQRIGQRVLAVRPRHAAHRVHALPLLLATHNTVSQQHTTQTVSNTPSTRAAPSAHNTQHSQSATHTQSATHRVHALPLLLTTHYTVSQQHTTQSAHRVHALPLLLTTHTTVSQQHHTVSNTPHSQRTKYTRCPFCSQHSQSATHHTVSNTPSTCAAPSGHNTQHTQ